MLGHFGPFCTILTIFDHFWPFWTILDHEGPFWTILDNFDYFWQFWPFLAILTIFGNFDHFSPFGTIFDHFSPFLTIFDRFLFYFNILCQVHCPVHCIAMQQSSRVECSILPVLLASSLSPLRAKGSNNNDNGQQHSTVFCTAPQCTATTVMMVNRRQSASATYILCPQFP